MSTNEQAIVSFENPVSAEETVTDETPDPTPEMKVIYEQGDPIYAADMRPRNVFLQAELRSTKIKAIGLDPDVLTRKGVIKLSRWITKEREDTSLLLPPLQQHPLVPMNAKGVPDPVLLQRCVGSMPILQRHLIAIFHKTYPGRPLPTDDAHTVDDADKSRQSSFSEESGNINRPATSEAATTALPAISVSDVTKRDFSAASKSTTVQ